MKKKIKPTESYNDFLPQRLKDSTKIKTLSEKNVLASLCYFYMSYYNYAQSHDGWFFCSHDEIIKDCKLEKAQVKRILVKLEAQTLISRKKQNGFKKPTLYKLHDAIVALMPKLESIDDNDLMSHNGPLNEPCVETTIANEPQWPSQTGLMSHNGPLNEPQDKLSKDKLSKDKLSKDKLSEDIVSSAREDTISSSLNVLKSKGPNTSNVSTSSFEEEGFVDVDHYAELSHSWAERFTDCKTQLECVQLLNEFRKATKLYGDAILNEELIYARANCKSKFDVSC